MSMPFGTYTNAMRTGALPGSLLAAIAGAIASRKGRAMLVPMPRRKVRLASALPVIIIAKLPSRALYRLSPLLIRSIVSQELRTAVQTLTDRNTELLFHREASLRWAAIARVALRRLRLLHR